VLAWTISLSTDASLVLSKRVLAVAQGTPIETSPPDTTADHNEHVTSSQQMLNFVRGDPAVRIQP
jgi:hypothetical protein